MVGGGANVALLVLARKIPRDRPVGSAGCGPGFLRKSLERW